VDILECMMRKGNYNAEKNQRKTYVTGLAEES
jgi:hypothetical protein